MNPLAISYLRVNLAALTKHHSRHGKEHECRFSQRIFAKSGRIRWLMRTPWRRQVQLTRNHSSPRQQPRDRNIQGFRKHKDFKIAHAAEADFNLGNAGSVDVRSRARDTIRQLLLCEPRPRPQTRLADTRANDVLS
jgi:hypothetical protein